MTDRYRKDHAERPTFTADDKSPPSPLVGASLVTVAALQKRIELLEGVLRKALDVISIPAEHHDREQKADAFAVTGLPRFSAGARRLNKECYELRPLLIKILTDP